MKKKQNVDKLDLSIVWISPEYAKDLLSKAAKNRNLNAGRITRYAQMMLDNVWAQAASMIMIDKNGRLLDGQHRLSAIVESGRGQNFVVLRNQDPSVMDVLDSGQRRTAAQVLSMTRNVKDSVRVAALARSFYVAMVLGEEALQRRIPNALGSDSARIAEMLDVYPWLKNYVGYYRNLTAVGIPTGRQVAMLGVLTRKPDNSPHEKFLEFFQKVCDGADISKTSPIYAYRRRAQRDEAKGGSTISASRLEPHEKMMLTVKAWNAWLLGRETTLIATKKTDKPVAIEMPGKRGWTGRQIVDFRKQAGLSQKELAEMMDMPPSELSAIERGTKPVLPHVSEFMSGLEA